MRYYLLFILVFSFINLSAQSVTYDSILPPVKKNLSKEELRTAIDGYLQMTKSETYRQFKKNLKDISLSLIRLNENEFNEYNNVPKADRDKVEKWLSKNIKKTKFNSVKQAADLICGTFKLMVKMRQENKKLYQLMRRATRQQIGDIIAPERRTVYDIMDDSLEN